LTETENIKPQNVILLIGDGMGLSQISAGMYTKRSALNIEKFKIIGLQKTHAKDDLITDSAASATAISRGIKVDNNTFGSKKNIKAPVSLMTRAENQGWSTGITVTSSITHATPAAFVSDAMLRNMHEDIAEDFLNIEVDFLVGGGKAYFDRRDKDERNLIKELRKKSYEVFSYLDGDIDEIPINYNKNFMYLTSDKEPLTRSAGRDYFVKACNLGLKFLAGKPSNKFFYVIESSQIDWGGHANVGELVIDEFLEFDLVIGAMLDYARSNKNTLVILTADHETGGFSILGRDPKTKKLEIAFTTKNHTATTIPVFAYGPGAEKFQGIYDNTEIFQKLKELMNL
jgi:alkaline phosphatase